MSNMKTITVKAEYRNEQVTATVGQFIGFKRDTEQYSKVKKIRFNGNGDAQVCVDVTQGDYWGTNVWIDLNRCWND